MADSDDRPGEPNQGDHLDDEQGAKQGYDYERGMAYTLWLLGRRDYSAKELRDRLRRKDTVDTVVDRVLARLTELDLIDDARFAATFVRARRRKKGILAIRQELRRKGIADAVAEQALTPVTDETQLAAASRILERHAWRFEAGDERARARAYAFLARRGFPPDVAADALLGSELFGEP